MSATRAATRLAKLPRSQRLLRSSSRPRTTPPHAPKPTSAVAAIQHYSSLEPAVASGSGSQGYNASALPMMSRDEAAGTRRAAPVANPFPDSLRPTPRSNYEKLVQRGELRSDEHQERIIDRLQALHDELVHYEQPPVQSASQASFLSKLFGSTPEPSETAKPPKGLYLYGDVGTGKTMLMDLFFETLPPNITKKRRVHFHAFMIDVHKRMHAMKASMGFAGGEPVEPVARDLAKEATVLCFDEFQVTDIVDAMILRRLLESLQKHGVVFVMTSNRHPDELYKNGIQRSSFVPCIELLKSKFEVIDLDSGTDYRRIPRAISNVYFHPLSREKKDEFDKLFVALATRNGQHVTHDRVLGVWGRKLGIPASADGVAKFTFDELCGHPLSAADYLEVTKTFNTIFLSDVPKMNLNQKDKARRFITFIDACYESRTKLFVTSEVPIYQVFSDDTSGGKDISDHQRSVMDDLGLSASSVGTSSMFTGEEEVFAFARCCSRLVQMGTKEWAEMSGSH